MANADAPGRGLPVHAPYQTIPLPSLPCATPSFITLRYPFLHYLALPFPLITLPRTSKGQPQARQEQGAVTIEGVRYFPLLP